VPSSTSLNITGALTLEAWVKTNLSSGDQMIVVRDDSNWWSHQASYSLELSNGKMRFDIYQSGSSYHTVFGSTVLSTGVWHHVAAVFDGSQMQVYLDGALDGSVASTMTPATGPFGVRIGRELNPYYPYYFNGLIDEVRISNTALYTSNFTPASSLSAGSSTAGLWRFDGQTANDSSSNGNNGTLSGGATYSTDTPGSSGGGSSRSP
jgi:hypothetical protein